MDWRTRRPYPPGCCRTRAGRNRVKQRHTIPSSSTVGGSKRAETGGQSAEGPPPGGGVRPDIMILEGWPETSPPPRGASKTYADQQQTIGGGVDGVRNEMTWNKKRRLGGRRVTIIIGELGFSSDLNPQKTVERKQHKYGPLIEELVREG